MAKYLMTFKDFEMGTLYWIMQVGPKCNCMCPYKREAEWALHREKMRYTKTNKNNVPVEADVVVICKQVSENWQVPEAARSKKQIVTWREHGLLTPKFWHCDTNFGPLVPNTVRQHFFFLHHKSSGNSSQQSLIPMLLFIV